jgi:hypothetical protein
LCYNSFRNSFSRFFLLIIRHGFFINIVNFRIIIITEDSIADISWIRITITVRIGSWTRFPQRGLSNSIFALFCAYCYIELMPPNM